MKTNIILLLSFSGLVFPSSIFSQSIFPDETVNQKWEYVTWNFWGGHCDTRIVKTGAKVVRCNQEYIQVLDCDENETDCYLRGFYRIQNDSVLIRNNQFGWFPNSEQDSVDCSLAESLLFDFSVNLEEERSCQISSTTPPALTTFWKVDETQMEYEGVNRTVHIMNYYPYPHIPEVIHEMRWIEGIGSNVYPLYSFTCIGDHCEWEQQLVRVYQNEELIYQDTTLDFSFPCTNVTDVEEIARDNNFKVFPNPAKDFIQIEPANNSNFHTFNLNIFDITGKLVHTLESQNINQIIPINFLGKGIYILELQSEYKSQQLKLIKQ